MAGYQLRFAEQVRSFSAMVFEVGSCKVSYSRHLIFVTENLKTYQVVTNNCANFNRRKRYILLPKNYGQLPGTPDLFVILRAKLLHNTQANVPNGIPDGPKLET